MNSNNKLEVTKPGEIKVLNLMEGDVQTEKKVKAEVITIAGKQVTLNQYGEHKLNEVESNSYHDWDKSCEVAVRECQEFMNESMDTPGQTYSGKSKIPYGIKYDDSGGMTITPMP